MSHAKPKTIVHTQDYEGCFSRCGLSIDGTFVLSSEVLDDVTCKRCLASLARRDREFQRKARRFLEHDRGEFGARLSAFGFGLGWSGFFREQAFRAIAREEGRDALRDFGRAIGLCS